MATPEQELNSRRSNSLHQARLLFIAAGALVVLAVLLFLGVFNLFLDNDASGIIAAVLQKAAGIAIALWAGRLMKRARQTRALSADEVVANDSRPPVLYIRSFQDDERAIHQYSGITKWIARRSSPAAWMPPPRYEELLTPVLASIGPVIAIGKPGEELPELGAARKYVGDDWRQEVLNAHRAAALVVVQAGTGAGLLWELRNMLQPSSFKPVLLCFPPDRAKGAPPEERFQDFKALFEQEGGPKLPAILGDAYYVWFENPNEGVALEPIRKMEHQRRTLPGITGIWAKLDTVVPGTEAKLRILASRDRLRNIAAVVYVLTVSLLFMTVVMGYFAFFDV